ncbi:YacL family protein [Rheinheimera sp.]|uniref:YacL family protein n=1 Tax=Rheinheimera sp. TaxID=1869214 RepID=UPI0037CC9422
MEYDFTYDRNSNKFGIRLAEEHEVLGRFLLEEFGQLAGAYQPLLQQLSALNSHQSMQYQGREYLLEIDAGEVTLSHNTLFYTTEQPLPERQQHKVADDDLQLDEQGMSMQCGLEDLLKLLRDWQQFLSE